MLRPTLRVIVSALAALSLLALSFGSASAQESDNGFIGVSTGVDVAYWSPSSYYDSEGESTEWKDVTDTILLAKLNLEYMTSFLPGLYVGLDIPYVSHTIEAGNDEADGSGVGDISAYLGFVQSVAVVRAGAQLRVKANTGTGDAFTDPGEAPTGGNSTNLQFSVFGDAGLLGANAYLEAGYVLTLESPLESSNGTSTTANYGDLVYTNLAFGYSFLGLVEPRLHVLFGTAGDTEMTEETDAGTSTNTIADSGAQWLALAFDVRFHLTDMLSAHVGWGTPLDAMGYNVPTGFMLSAKNMPAGPAMANAGVRVNF